ncbi:MAG TPA: hypothetical protein VN802_11830 [Stellaceae bacterium]|nr:hypothetical protein [Stellaceae bacterium]
MLRLGTVGDPRLWLLFHYWQVKLAGGAMPSPDAINLAELPPAVQPNAMLLDVAIEGGRRRFRYRSVGGVFWRASGKEPVGRYIDEVLPETAGYRDYVVGIYEEMAAKRRPMYTENMFILSHGQRDPMTTKRVSLPLSRDGAAVHAVLAAHVFDYGAGGDDAFALVTAIEEGVRTFLE